MITVSVAVLISGASVLIGIGISWGMMRSQLNGLKVTLDEMKAKSETTANSISDMRERLARLETKVCS